MDSKMCSRCKVEKEVTLFYTRADYTKQVKYRSWCKACCDAWPTSSDRRLYAIKKRHGLSEEQYEALWTKQTGRCAICKLDLNTFVPKNRHIDHNHVTGEIRGILCTNCNRGLGHFKDSSGLLENAAHYLTK